MYPKKPLLAFVASFGLFLATSAIGSATVAASDGAQQAIAQSQTPQTTQEQVAGVSVRLGWGGYGYPYHGYYRYGPYRDRYYWGPYDNYYYGYPYGYYYQSPYRYHRYYYRHW